MVQSMYLKEGRVAREATEDDHTDQFTACYNQQGWSYTHSDDPASGKIPFPTLERSTASINMIGCKLRWHKPRFQHDQR